MTETANVRQPQLPFSLPVDVSSVRGCCGENGACEAISDKNDREYNLIVGGAKVLVAVFFFLLTLVLMGACLDAHLQDRYNAEPVPADAVAELPPF